MNTKLQALHNELTEAFIKYQWNLDNPFPNSASQEELINKYRSDSLFRAKVDQLSIGVMHIVRKYIED